MDVMPTGHEPGTRKVLYIKDEWSQRSLFRKLHDPTHVVCREWDLGLQKKLIYKYD